MRRRPRFVLLAALLSVALAAAATPAKEFTEHRVVTPRLVHAASGNSLAHTAINGTSKHHVSAVTLIIDDITIDLKINENLIPDQYFEKYHEQVSYCEHLRIVCIWDLGPGAVSTADFLHYYKKGKIAFARSTVKEISYSPNRGKSY
jgi:hypothetical protein